MYFLHVEIRDIETNRILESHYYYDIKLEYLQNTIMVFKISPLPNSTTSIIYKKEGVKDAVHVTF